MQVIFNPWVSAYKTKERQCAESIMSASSLSGTPREAPRSTKEKPEGALNVRERCVEGKLLSGVRRQAREAGASTVGFSCRVEEKYCNGNSVKWFWTMCCLEPIKAAVGTPPPSWRRGLGEEQNGSSSKIRGKPEVRECCDPGWPKKSSAKLGHNPIVFSVQGFLEGCIRPGENHCALPVLSPPLPQS